MLLQHGKIDAKVALDTYSTVFHVFVNPFTVNWLTNIRERGSVLHLGIAKEISNLPVMHQGGDTP